MNKWDDIKNRLFELTNSGKRKEAEKFITSSVLPEYGLFTEIAYGLFNTVSLVTSERVIAELLSRKTKIKNNEFDEELTEELFFLI